MENKTENPALEFEIVKTGFGENASSVLVCSKQTTKNNEEFYFIVTVNDVGNLEDLAHKVKVKKTSCGPHDVNKLFRYYNLDIKKPYSMFIKYLDGSLKGLEIENIESIIFKTVESEFKSVFKSVNFGLKNSIIIKFKDKVKEKDINSILTNADKIIFKDGKKDNKPGGHMSEIKSKLKQHVIFSREGLAASVFDLEEVFNKVKKNTIINTSSEVLFDRLRLAVKNKEIEPFDITVIDLDGKIYTSSLTEKGSVCCCENSDDNTDIYNSKALNVRMEILMAIMGGQK